jgi:hypothetical protein
MVEDRDNSSDGLDVPDQPEFHPATCIFYIVVIFVMLLVGYYFTS